MVLCWELMGLACFAGWDTSFVLRDGTPPDKVNQGIKGIRDKVNQGIKGIR